MNRRGTRLTLGVVVLGIGVVGVLVVLNWGMVRDHVEAWHFQLTRETVTFFPDFERSRDLPIDATAAEGTVYVYTEGTFFGGLADYSGYPVILDPAEHRATGSNLIPTPIPWLMVRESVFTCSKPLPGSKAKELLLSFGNRILEQRFPRRAYVVIRDESVIRDEGPPIFSWGDSRPGTMRSNVATPKEARREAAPVE